MKVTGQKTTYESRASLDGKILFLVLAHPDHCDAIEKYIQEKDWEELFEYIVLKFISMVESSSNRTAKFNKDPIKQEELKPIDIGNIIKNRQESFRRVSKKILLHEKYY